MVLGNIYKNPINHSSYSNDKVFRELYYLQKLLLEM